MTAIGGATARVDQNLFSGRRARLRDLFAAEWIKFWSLRSTTIALAAVTAWYLYRTYQLAQESYTSWLGIPAAIRGAYDPSMVFRGPEWFLIMVVAGSVGALTVVGEHASGLIRTTFTAVPDRLRVAAAKVAVVAVVMTGVGAIVAAGSFAVEQAALRGHHIDFSPSEPGARSLVVSTTLLLPVCALAGMAIGALIRNTAVTVFVTCVLFILVPLFFKSPSTRWAVDVGNALPCYAWGRLTMMGRHAHILGAVPGEAAAWTAFAGWSVVSAVIVATSLHRRDV